MEASPLTDRHLAAGARLGARPEAERLAAPLTFGDVPAEYAAAREGCALFDATDRGALAVRGADAGAFLHRILANDVRGLEVGAGNRNLLLTPKGKVLFAFDVTALEDGFALSTPPGSADALRAAIDGYLFSDDVRLEVTTGAHAPLELAGPAARAVVEHALGTTLELAEGETRFVGASAVRAHAVAGVAGYRIDAGPGRAAGPERAAELWDELSAAGARPAGLVVRDILRVESCTALWGVDVDENVYPQEARLEEAFSLTKGCYVGQEVVAKIDTYGGLNKRLMFLRVDHDDPLQRGTRLGVREGGELRDLGVVTSWAYSFALDTGAALAFVKRRHQAPGTTFALGNGGGNATIAEPPFARER